MMNWESIRIWLKAALIRALRTFSQTAVAAIGVSACLSDVEWGTVLSMSTLAALLSVLTSLCTGLPEAGDGEK